MPDITISITDTEQKALEYVMADISDWTDNAVVFQLHTAMLIQLQLQQEKMHKLFKRMI